MTTGPAWRPRRSARTALLATAATAVAALAAGGGGACPLGGHDGPRARLLHALQQREQHGGGHRLLAQAPRQPEQSQQVQQQSQQAQQPAQQPGRTEIGAYARDLPRGAAAPTAETPPPLLGTLGRFSRPAGTANPQAQAYFDQGHRLGWAFNHAEAARAFRAAQALDPSCAMCFWGEAWVLGPHINYPMDADANRRALAALDEARRLAPRAGGLDAALIEALSRRHSPDPNADRKALDQAYADAMEAVQARSPRTPAWRC